MKPYFEQGGISVYCGHVRDVLATMDASEIGLVLADPPYGVTSLAWDRWPDSWPMTVAGAIPDETPLWCFGSMRMFVEHMTEFTGAGWRFAQDVIWEKHNGSNFHADRFRRVHEMATQWYRGDWGAVFKEPQFTQDVTARQVRRKGRPAHTGEIKGSSYVSEDGGSRLMRSVLQVPSVHGDTDVFNETQKPLGILEPLIRYSLAPGKVLLDPFCGAGSSLVVAKQLGARAVGIDIREEQCEATARRLTQTMAFGTQPPAPASDTSLVPPLPEVPPARAVTERREPRVGVSGAGPDAPAALPRREPAPPKRMTVFGPDGEKVAL